MKLIFSEIVNLLTRKQERNIKALLKFFLALVAMVTIYSILFHILMLAEGLNVFRVAVHPSLIGSFLAESSIRSDTGCSVIAVSDQGRMIINPDPSFQFAEGNELILIGTNKAEERFFEAYTEASRL